MSKSITDELVKILEVKKPKRSKNNNQIKGFLMKEVWDGRPINWLAIVLAYGSIAYTAYVVSQYFVRIPEFVGIVAFATTFVIGSRAFKSK